MLGGTWSEYPPEYQEEFLRDIFWSANTFFDARPKRARLSLEQEQVFNETARVRLIGLTLETRPDSIDQEEIRRLRRFGCTRVQLGIQHTNDAILKKINRGCTTADACRAVRLLKDACFKIDFHLMPDLPGACVHALVRFASFGFCDADRSGVRDTMSSSTAAALQRVGRYMRLHPKSYSDRRQFLHRCSFG